ncbi:MAG: mechanosensitive ion channel [Lachnospiraceae bacterium]|nr:mechanosensitive ion channel [Lachnospiraceae bacterium]
MQTLPTRATAFAIKATFALIILVGGCYLIKIIRIILKKSLEKARVDLSIRHFIDSLVKVSLFALLLIYIASYFGVETTSLVALLGSAGVTIALAIQGSLSNITGGVLILLLKPFKLGDYIHEDNNGNEGVVKEIGLFYTKLHTLDGRTVVLPNGPLANTSLINVNMAPMRQLIVTVGISYDSDIDKARELILEVLNSSDLILKDLQKKVYVESLDESAVTLGVRAFVKNEDYFEAKWYFTEAVKKSFDKNGVSIPFNQLDVHIKEEKE